MTKKPIVAFLAKLHPENLGVNYLSSMLISKGFDVHKFDFEIGKDFIVKHLLETDYVLVGFSLIYQYDLPSVGKLASFFRENGVKCHFTVGGHYPSLRYADTLNSIPELDSVVRFEGEFSICELASKLLANAEWHDIKGIAYRKNGEPFSNDLRPLVADLDTLPFPTRRREEMIICMNKLCANMLAKRGCAKSCTFCSIRKFYGKPPGNLIRTRTPRKVIEEMKQLHERYEVCIFLFQDDDFFAAGKRWIKCFIDELRKEGLENKFMWKISCRPDEIDEGFFRKLKDVGLFYVYMGIESGNQTGLSVLNKHLSVEQNVSAVETLKRLGLLYDFGFMLTDPMSNFETIRENIAFLRRICSDGSCPVGFCKMIPYAETDIEGTLMREGRLKGSVTAPDYDFLCPKLDQYVKFLHNTYREWMFSQTGLRSRLQWYRFELGVLQKFCETKIQWLDKYLEVLREIIVLSNESLLKIAEEAIPFFESSRPNGEALAELVALKNNCEQHVSQQLYTQMIKVRMSQHAIV